MPPTAPVTPPCQKEGGTPPAPCGLTPPCNRKDMAVGTPPNEEKVVGLKINRAAGNALRNRAPSGKNNSAFSHFT